MLQVWAQKKAPENVLDPNGVPGVHENNYQLMV